MKKVFLLVFLLLLGLTGCRQSPGDAEISQGPEMKSAAESAIRTYLKSRPGLAMDKMDLIVEEVRVEGDTAVAQVVFKTKEGEGAMPFTYNLRREGNGWTVVRKGTEANDALLPPNHPSTTKDPAPAH